MVPIVVLLLILLFVFGAPIFAVMLTAGAYGATHTAREGFLQDFGAQMSDIVTLGTGEPAQILSTIPLFIFTGFLMAESRTADRLVKAARPIYGWLPGGLAIVTVFTCAAFTTFTGASGVTIVALGGLVMPSLLKEQYPERFSLGLVAGTGSMGLLFPPALPLFIYGTVYGLAAQTQQSGGEGGEMKLIEFSTDRFVFAGIIPGLILCGVVCLYAVYVALRRGIPHDKFTLRRLIYFLCPPVALFFEPDVRRVVPEALLPLLVIAGLANGIAIPEIAALATVYILLVEIVWFRDLPVAKLWPIVRESMALVGAIFIIIFAASALTNFFITAEVPRILFEWIQATFESKWSFLLALNVFLLVVGMTMDIFSAIVVVVPLITPVAAHYGIDPYHLGIVFLLNLELGYLTPPVGLNLFITGFTFRKPINEVIRATIPFLGCMVIALGLVTYIPALTVVPPAEKRGLVSQLARDTRAAYDRATALTEVTLPGGRVFKVDECEAKTNELDKQSCMGIFLDVTRCRANPDKAAAAECEKEAIASWIELNMDEDELDVGDGDGDALDALEDMGDGDEGGDSDALDALEDMGDGDGDEGGDSDALDALEDMGDGDGDEDDESDALKALEDMGD